MRLPELPILDALPALRDALRTGPTAVLVAPPGAGKTTVVPLALLDEPWVAGRRLVMLEPRRLAARAAAERMANLLGERAGETVGYRMRMETRISARTRIEVVTEGVLARLLHADPALEAYAAVIMDEFHERSLHADLGLALVQQSRELLRGDLRLLVMSATLEAEPVAALVGGDVPAPVIRSEGRSYPVEVRWRPPRAEQSLESAVAGAVREALDTVDGDLLVFLPGAAEIRRAQDVLLRALEADSRPRRVRVLPLHGSLPPAEQDAALAPAAPDERKVVLATAIAETSLTIEGVRGVVDAGLARVPRFDPRSGMARLTTTRVSQASAEQRRGRAGRVAPGVCWRLWAEHEHVTLPPRATPEILEADLAPLALELAAAGVRDASELAWLDAPPAAALAQARALLFALGAVDADGRVTPHGRAMADLPVHPRLAHLLLVARELGRDALAAACDLAALLGERDVVRGEGGPPPADLRARLALVAGEGASELVTGLPGARADRGTVHRVRQQARALRRRLRVPPGARSDGADVGLLVALAYPERVAQRREAAGRYLMRGGTGAALPPDDPLAREPWLAVAETDGRRPEARIALAAPVDGAVIARRFAAWVEVDEAVEWDERTDAVVARRRERLGAIVLREVPLREVDDERVATALLGWIRRAGLDALPWSPAARRVRERLAFAHRLEPDEWPDVRDAALLASLEDWLLPFLHGVRRRDELARVDLQEALLAMLAWPQRAALDALAPTHVTLPSGTRAAVDYADPENPVLAVRLQELFGVSETPTVGGGRVPLLLHLLSPARRPVQVTRDLAGFWRTSYHDVRKEMKGRYPKHAWPEDPLR